jgi:hypothetical protein
MPDAWQPFACCPKAICSRAFQQRSDLPGQSTSSISCSPRQSALCGIGHVISRRHHHYEVETLN